MLAAFAPDRAGKAGAIREWRSVNDCNCGGGVHRIILALHREHCRHPLRESFRAFGCWIELPRAPSESGIRDH